MGLSHAYYLLIDSLDHAHYLMIDSLGHASNALYGLDGIKSRLLLIDSLEHASRALYGLDGIKPRLLPDDWQDFDHASSTWLPRRSSIDSLHT